MTATTLKDKKYARIREAAAAVFLAHGFSGSTTDMIQRLAGVSKATLYSHFPGGKEEMFASVIEHQCAKMEAAIRNIAAVPGDIHKTLEAIGHSYLKLVLSDDGIALFRVVIGEAPRFPDLARLFFNAGPTVAVAMAAERLAQAIAAGEISIGHFSLKDAAGLFITLIRSEGHLELLTHPGASPSEAQIDRWVNAGVTAFLQIFRSDDLH